MFNFDDFVKNARFATILTTGRTGSDYLNACLHGLNEIVTLNSPINFFREFLNKDRCNYGKIDKIPIDQILNDFCLFYKEKLFKEDLVENKKIELDINEFKKILRNNFLEKNISIRNFFLLVHYVYHLLENRKIDQNSLVLYHAHSFGETEEFLKLFPKSYLLITIRDPRDNLKSSLINTSKYRSQITNAFFFRKITRIYNDIFLFKEYFKQKKFFIKLETANKKYNKKKLCNFLKIEFNKKIMTATYGKNSFYSGDIYSEKQNLRGEYNNKRNQWLNYFMCYEKVILNKIFNRFSVFGYKFYKHNLLNNVFFIIFCFLPFKFELKIFKDVKNLRINIFFYFKRIKYFLSLIKNKNI
jgi:hypothetical protein